ncbi:MAG TPA: hypothetical protein VFP65_00505 [Anaeromyxobacteraceae bacterium]|nr:hypothetical protein [Anaeromyxobacteraceae bacterium]
MSFDRARRIADAVLLEGYVLYPYRASSAKNRWRFPFGVLAPRDWSEAGGCEPWWMEAQCLVEPLGSPHVRGRLRFLRARRRTVAARDPVDGSYRPVDALDAGGRLALAWDEGEAREVDFEDVPGASATVPFAMAAERQEEPLPDASGAPAGRVLRAGAAISGVVAVRSEPVPADRPLLRLSVRVENRTSWADPAASRDAILPASCLAAHLLLAVEGGAFVSLLDPPAWAAAAAAACRSTRAYPVLAGAEGERDLVLASPIILYDHPRIAPESPGDFFDACEIDELLALRTATLGDAEKREARATDPRAAAVLDRVAGLSPELLGQLHGATRDLRAAEMVPRAPPPAGGSVPRPGQRVRLRPGCRRTDAQDLLYAGLTATVRAVHRDVDDGEWLAVTIDDDPAAELHDWYGRHHYYRLDEVEPLAEEGAAP